MADGANMRGPGRYALGIDLGTTYTAAAVYRNGQVTMVDLATRSTVAPSVVLVRPDGSALYGEAADRRALVEPSLVAREFKRRLGDSVPILLGGSPHSPQSLGARLLAWVVERVTEVEGGPPAALAVTHPANWGPYKQEVFGQLLGLAGCEHAERLTEPEAAAVAYAADERPPPEAHLAVYDLGGGTFDTVVVRRVGERFAIVGRPGGIEHLGGIDFDEALYRWVWSQATDGAGGFDAADEAARRDLLALRRECVTAKEALSVDTDVVVAVRVGPVQRDVTVSRGQLEDLIRPTLGPTIVSLGRVVYDAGLTPEELHGVLLVGGSSRIPLVTELIEEELGRPVALDVHPKHVVARGAVLVAAASLPQGIGGGNRAAHQAGAATTAPAAPRPVVDGSAGPYVARPYAAPSHKTRLRPILIVAAVITAGLAIGGLLARNRGGDTDGNPAKSTTTQSSTTAGTATRPQVSATSISPNVEDEAARAFNSWNVYASDQNLDMRDADAATIKDKCAAAILGAATTFGELRPTDRVPSQLYERIVPIRADVRDQMLLAISSRLESWRHCQNGERSQAIRAENEANIAATQAVKLSTAGGQTSGG